MNFNEGQKVIIRKKSVGVSYENSRVCQSCREKGFVTYVEKFVDNYYGTGHFHSLSDSFHTADFLDGDFIALLPSIIEVDE
ncbi:MAG TPA: hypothetical protein PLW61_07840 [Caldisericia bacterium]|nr:hypothetical protein [Caldisericia bacterium]